MADYAYHSSLIACRNRLPGDLSSANMLIVNCGGGWDTRFFQLEGVYKITVTDISSVCLQKTASRCPGVRTIMADTARLPFSDNSFDFVGVRSGLHHLQNPLNGIKEMARVARQAFFFIEGHQTIFTPLLVRLGLLEGEEKAGNQVYRFKVSEVANLFRYYGSTKYTVDTAWFMQIPPLIKAADHIPGKFPALLLRVFVQIFNFFLGKTGNSIVAVCYKRSRATIHLEK
jgi:ubiquinone/menaquinone biosynthesis C-methylase UbiE